MTPALNQIVHVLANSEIDLANEIAAMIVLVKARFTSEEILAHLDEGRKLAVDKRSQGPLRKLFARVA